MSLNKQEDDILEINNQRIFDLLNNHEKLRKFLIIDYCVARDVEKEKFESDSRNNGKRL